MTQKDTNEIREQCRGRFLEKETLVNLNWEKRLKIPYLILFLPLRNKTMNQREDDDKGRIPFDFFSINGIH